MFVSGTYRVIEPPDEHAGISSEVAVSIAARGGRGARLIRREQFERPDAESRHSEAWRGALAQLEALVASAEADDGDR